MDFKSGFDLLFYGAGGIFVGVVLGFVTALVLSWSAFAGIALAIAGGILGMVIGVIIADRKN